MSHPLTTRKHQLGREGAYVELVSIDGNKTEVIEFDNKREVITKEVIPYNISVLFVYMRYNAGIYIRYPDNSFPKGSVLVLPLKSTLLRQNKSV